MSRRSRYTFCLRASSSCSSTPYSDSSLLSWQVRRTTCTCNQSHTHPFNGPFLGLPRWAGTRKVKPIWILLKQEIVSGSGISWAICKSAPRSRQITKPAPHHSVFLQAGCPSYRPTNSVKALKATCNQSIVTKILPRPPPGHGRVISRRLPGRILDLCLFNWLSIQ